VCAGFLRSESQDERSNVHCNNPTLTHLILLLITQGKEKEE
jgi:hypothetical protein